MPTKLTILTQLSRGELQWIADQYELAVEDRRRLDDLHSAIRRLPKATLREILMGFERHRLKEICRGLDLDDSGKLKSEIANRLVGRDEDDGEDDDSSVNHESGNKEGTTLVDQLTRNELLEIVDYHELAVDDRRKRESAAEVVSRLSKSDLGDVLQYFSRDRLKDLCVALGLDDSGKTKSTLVHRLLGQPTELDGSDKKDDSDAERDGEEIEEAGLERARKVTSSNKSGQLRLFIGSSVESLKVAKRVQVELDYEFDATIWHQNLFEPGAETWRQLVNMARKDFDFALFVFGPDDAIESRKETAFSPRDNVLLEYGLFVGAIGPERTFFLYNRSHKPKIASDLAGITALTYRDRDNLQAALGPACTQLHDICERLGQR